MQDKRKTKEQLLNELARLREHNAELETSLTDIRRTEKHIRRLASFPDFNPNPVIEVNSSGGITFFNQATEKTLKDLGMTRADIKAFFPEGLMAFLRHRSKKSKPTLTCQIVINDRIFSENIYFAPEYNVARIYVTDITEYGWMQKKTQQLLNAVQEEKNKLSALVNSIQDEVWFADAGKRFTLVNPSAVKEFNLNALAKEIDVETFARSLEVHRPDGSPRPVDEAPPLRALKGEVVISQEEMIRTPARGDLRYREVSAAPVRDFSGTVIGSVSVVRDITDRKQAEEALHKAYEELELRVQERTAQLRRQAELLDLAHDAVILSDQDGRVAFWNKGAQDTYGFTKEEVIGKLVHTLLQTKFDIPLEDIVDIAKREGHWEGELAHTCKDGREVTVHSRWALRHDEVSGSIEIMQVNRDTTVRKRAEEALRTMSEYNRSLIEASVDPLVTINPGGRISDVNIATERVTGYSRERLIGTDFSDYFTDPEKAKVGYQLVFKEGIVRDYELEIRRSDGHVTPVLYNASLYKDEAGTVIGVFAAARDISERRHMEQDLRESEERYRTAIESASDGIALVQRDRHMYVNARFAEIFGYEDSREIIGKSHSLTVHPDDLARVSETNRMRQKGEPVPSRYEFKGIRKDGTLIFIEVSAARISYRGEPASLVYLRDITDYKNLEEQLRQSQKMEAIGTLAGGIAHDFNNILAAIIGFAEMIEEDISLGKPDIEQVQRVLNAAYRGRDLVKQILTFSRKTEHVRGALSVSPLIKETVQLLRASLPATITIKFSMSTTEDTVLASPVEIQRILMNLATNAAFAMHESGGTLNVNLSNVDFKPNSLFVNTDVKQGKYVQLTVTDTGTGMTPDVTKRVFDPFFTTKEVGEGAGMGLAVVYGIVKSLQGVITVESQPGIGSTFRVLLPKVMADRTSEAFEAPRILKGTERILFVDDEELLIEWGQALLERLGYEVTAKQDSTKCLELFKENPLGFDLVITDQTMPKLTGLRLARELLKIRPDIPIILCTGHSDSVSPEKVKGFGVKEFLMKPLAKKELAEVIRRVLDAKPQS